MVQSKRLDGRATAELIRGEVAADVARLVRPPTLAVVLVGENPASVSYVTAKERDCASVGITSVDMRFPSEISQRELLDVVMTLNGRDDVDGILVQLPLPDHIDSDAIIDAIEPSKDVDGFHEVSAGRLLLGRDGFVPCTPAGVIELLQRSGETIAGRHIVVVGRSAIVGRPLAVLLARKGIDATVTLCHSRTRDIFAHTRTADIVVAAIGQARFIRGEMVREGAVVVDVGVNRIDDPTRKSGYRLVGDVDEAEIDGRAAAFSPVPGGVGPMTRAMLLVNTVRAATERARAEVAS